MKLKNQRVKGFTLVELIIVIAIIGVLARNTRAYYVGLLLEIPCKVCQCRC